MRKKRSAGLLILGLGVLVVVAVVAGNVAERYGPRPPAVRLTPCEQATNASFSMCAYAAKHPGRGYEQRCDAAIEKAEQLCGPSGPEEPPVPGFPLGDSK